MRIPQNIIEEVSSRVSLQDVVSGYLTLERKGGRLWGLCPFHEEKTPSFSVSVDDNVFYCFGCQKGGNLFSFVQEMENLSFPEAVRHLAERAGIEIPDDDTPENSNRATLIELNSRVTLSFRYLLEKSDRAEGARRYLADRGVSDKTAETFKLGYAPNEKRWLYDFLRRKNYSDDFLAISGLFSKRYPQVSMFIDRLIFPIQNRRGETVAFGGRALGDREPKYINSPDTEAFSKRSTLFGLREALPTIRKERAFILAEGYLDVIALHQAEIGNAVAPLGTSFTPEQVRALHRYADTGLLLFDGDSAGIRAAEKAVATCEREGIESEVVLLPDGRDPGDYMRLRELQSLGNVLKNRQKGFMFVLDQATSQNDVREAGGKESVLRHLLPFVDIAQSEVRKQAFLDEIADALRVDPGAVRTDYENQRHTNVGAITNQDRRSARGADQSNAVSRQREDKRAQAVSQELYLMLAVALNRREFQYVRSQVKVDDLIDARARDLYVVLEECFRTEENSMDALLQRISDESLRQLVVEKEAKEEFADHGEMIIRDSVIRIKERSLRQKRDLITSDIRRLEKEMAPTVEIRPLMEEKMWIDSELEKLKDSLE